MLAIFLVICAVVALCVAIHYEILYRLTRIMPLLEIRYRLRIVVGVVAALFAHLVEIWIFAITYYVMHHAEKWGHLKGDFDGSLAASVYYSFTTYTTLGFGDIAPSGDLRFLTGVESLIGLVFITWTASFLYIEMSRYWD